MRFWFVSLPMALLRLSFYCFVFFTPLLGVWFVSSLLSDAIQIQQTVLRLHADSLILAPMKYRFLPVQCSKGNTRLLDS